MTLTVARRRSRSAGFHPPGTVHVLGHQAARIARQREFAAAVAGAVGGRHDGMPRNDGARANEPSMTVEYEVIHRFLTAHERDVANRLVVSSATVDADYGEAPVAPFLQKR